MIPTIGYAAQNSKSALKLFHFNRRELRQADILIEILYCGVCHSDIHQSRDEWGGSIYPMVPGHEIVGKVIGVGSKVSRYQLGDWVGVGCLVDACRSCSSCEEGLEQYCEKGWVGTYNSLEKDGVTPTYGGYSNQIVVDERFVLKIPKNLDPAKVAPLLCAGITTYSPLMHWQVGPGKKVGIIGLGGLGHMGVKLARALGAHVTVFTHSKYKFEDAQRLGADEVVLSSQENAFRSQAGSFHLLLDTVSAQHDLNPYFQLLKRDGTLVVLGVPVDPPTVQVFNLIGGRRSLAGSLIGGITETQKMLDYCGVHGITSDVEIIPIHKINEAYERMMRGDVKYRFVIDMKSLLNSSNHSGQG